MKNFIQPGKTLTLAMPYDRTSGQGVQVKSVFGVCAFDALSGIDCEVDTQGVFELTKIGTQAWAVGEAIYWDNTNKRCTSVGTGNLFIGYCTKAVGSGAGETLGNVLIGVKAGNHVRQGQSTTVAASDTIATGLSKLDGAIAVLDSDPVDDPFMATASIGDQNGAPAAGSFLLKTWKNTGGTDPTPAAATTFSKKVNWMAWGT